MTTKYKIISGFLFMVLLLGGVAFLGYAYIQKASNAFDEYRRLARLNVSTSDLEVGMNKASYEVYRFVENRDPQFMDSARKTVDATADTMRETKEFIRKPDRLNTLGSIDKDMQAFRRLIDAIQKGILDSYGQYLTVVQPNAQVMAEALRGMAQQARQMKNVEALFAVNTAWSDAAGTRSAMSRFAESRSEKDGARARHNLEELNDSLKKVGSTLQTAEGRKLFEDSMQSLTVFNESFARMEALSAEYRKNATEMNSLLQRLLVTTKGLSSDVNGEMLEFGRVMLQSNADAQKYMLVISGIGFLLGTLFAAYIVYGIIRVLNEVAGFARAVSQGDFTYTLRVNEKGEIGNMIGAMKQIPSVLERVMRQANSLANDIMSGKFRNRLAAAEFAGSFANLATAVNTVSNAYTTALDGLPVPIMACDKKNAILFLNNAAQTALGGNYAKEECGEHLKAAECRSDKCFGRCAMSTNAPHSGEMIIFPQGRRMDVAVTALPLRDMQDATVGYVEIITDLTEVKAKQAVMLRVAGEASEISDRVAAASEELAAQVEQISRGAEMQRTRVESTASAMTEMNSTVLEVARSAGQASKQSEGTRQKAEEGAGLVNKVVSSINVVNAVAATLQGNMQDLGKQAESIGGVMNVISDIADQTNLLALNAAIEAARAGEAGRGFAVVADEVRKLAEKTMQATQEVGNSINAIQQSAHTNITEVGNAVKSISDATNLADSSGLALKEIVDLAAANSSVVASIATAAEEQSATSEEINRAVDEINRVVGETTDGMAQSSAAVQDLSRMAQELRRVMEGLR